MIRLIFSAFSFIVRDVKQAAFRKQTATGQTGIRFFTMWVRFRRRSITKTGNQPSDIVERLQ
jgi:hypothetical protein